MLSKSEGLSRLVYTAMVLDVPPVLVKQIDTLLFNFVWRNKPYYLKKKVLCNTYCEGGLNVFGFHTSNTIFKVKLLWCYRISPLPCVLLFPPYLCFLSVSVWAWLHSLAPAAHLALIPLIKLL